jgi:hypothetical protein
MPFAWLFALVLLVPATKALASSDLPPLRPTWEPLAEDTFGCLQEASTKSIWQSRADQRRYEAPSPKELQLLVIAAEPGECTVFRRGEKVLIDNARIDLTDGFGPVRRSSGGDWFWITIGAMPAETPDAAYPRSR